MPQLLNPFLLNRRFACERILRAVRQAPDDGVAREAIMAELALASGHIHEGLSQLLHGVVLAAGGQVDVNLAQALELITERGALIIHEDAVTGVMHLQLSTGELPTAKDKLA